MLLRRAATRVPVPPFAVRGRLAHTHAPPSDAFRAHRVWQPPHHLTLVGAPLGLGQPRPGAETGPQDLRDAGLVEALRAHTPWCVQDAGDVGDVDGGTDTGSATADGDAHNAEAVGRVCERLYGALRAEATSDRFLLTLGGDHAVAAGTLSAVLRHRPRTKVVWVDAHADLHTPATSPSGNLHGMPLGLLTHGVHDRSAASLPGFGWLRPCLDPEDLVYVGLRDVDAYEQEAIRRLGIRAYTMFDIDRLGIGEVMRQVGEHVGHHNVHLSFDIDACDPFFAPSTGTAVGGGLTFREAHFICEYLADTRRLTSMEMVEVNTAVAPASGRSTVDVAKGLVLSALGSSIMWPVEAGRRYEGATGRPRFASGRRGEGNGC